MTFMAVTDFNLRNAAGFVREPSHACGEAGVRPIDGACATAYVSTLCCQVSQSVSHTQLLPPRSVPEHGVRAVDVPRELARYRNLSAGPLDQALSSGDSRRHRAQHLGRCQREARLADLPGFRTELDPHRANAPRARQLCAGVGQYARKGRSSRGTTRAGSVAASIAGPTGPAASLCRSTRRCGGAPWWWRAR